MELHFQPVLKLLDLGAERFQLRFRERRHFGVGGRIVDQLLQIVPLMRGAPELGDSSDDRVELGELAAEANIALLIGAGGKGALHRLPTVDELVELIGGNRHHAVLDRVRR